jgi:hypothetical protein
MGGQQVKNRIARLWRFWYCLVLFAPLSLVGAEAQQAPLFWDDFEAQDFSAWNGVGPDALAGGSGVVTSERAHSGRFSFKATLPAPDTHSKLSHILAPQQDLYFRFFFYVDPNWTEGRNNVFMAGIEDGAKVFLHSEHNCLSLQDRMGAKGSHCIAKGVWHSLEIHSRAGAGDGLIEVWLDGEADYVARDLKLGTVFKFIYLGLVGDETARGSVFFDDVVAATSRIGAPASWVTMRHPNTLGRVPLPVDLVFYGFEHSDKIVAQLDGKDIFTRTDLSVGWLRLPVDLSRVSAGDHNLTISLEATSGRTKALSRSVLHQYPVQEKSPRVTIDLNNSLRWNGQAYFPVSPFDFMRNPEASPYRLHKAINTYGWCECVFGPEYAAKDFDACARRLDLPVIGPARWWPGTDIEFVGAAQPTALDRIADYVKKARNNPRLAMWSWQDEPDLGGKVSVYRMAEVVRAADDNDGNHPVVTNLAGYQFNVLNDRHLGWYFPVVPAGDALPADVYSFDMYPLIYQKKLGTTVSQLVQNIDRVERYTYGMVPLMTFIEAGKCVQPSCAGIGPSGPQVYMEAWLAVIHGVKGVFWWGPGGWTDEDESHWKAVAQFKKDIDQLKDVILSPSDRSATSDRLVPHARVDATVREDSSCVYVFAARLTDAGENDPDLVTHLTVSGVKNGVARVLNEGRTVPVRNGVIEDVFAPAAVHLYCISKAR